MKWCMVWHTEINELIVQVLLSSLNHYRCSHIRRRHKYCSLAKSLPKLLLIRRSDGLGASMITDSWELSVLGGRHVTT